MKQFTYIGLLLASAVLTACTSFVNSDGTPAGELVFPDVADASQPEGIFPNLKNLDNIGSGVTKKDLYYLIGHPHFSATNGGQEWNYIMKFRQPDRSVKMCQYKVLFDNDDIARNFYWLPADCLNNNNKVVRINTDVLFRFDRASIADIKPMAKQKLDKIVQQVANKNTIFTIVGHTDRLGDDAYNMQLSQQRAESIKQYLVNQGIDSQNISAQGVGETKPVVACEGTTGHSALITCLAPNRRVDIKIKTIPKLKD
ncbi:MAG: OmpA family protein [Ostreibacterium sp.]